VYGRGRQFLSMIKSLTDALNRAGLAHADNLAQHVYHVTMAFVAGPLNEAINNAKKKKKPSSSLGCVLSLVPLCLSVCAPAPVQTAPFSHPRTHARVPNLPTACAWPAPAASM
jgi:hypothetical protein